MCTCVGAAQAPVRAQVTEAVGSRAAGMGGAFVAVASDSSATWWNPAGLAAGPYVDVALARGVVEVSPEAAEDIPETGVWRQRTSWFALGTPVIGVSYYRLRLTDIQRSDPTGGPPAGREDRGAGVPVRSLAASQLGVTLVQTILPGVHTGATLKYMRGAFATGRGDVLAAPSELLDAGDALASEDGDGRFDLDLGVLATAGIVRLGARVRNVREPRVGSVQFERQTRVGLAFDGAAIGGPPLTVALDADVDEYTVAAGARRVVAVGAEHWVWNRRLGLRAGGRFNRVGARERSATVGASVAVRGGLYLDGHVVRGAAADERGWGVAARVSF
ncbi:MAG: hypothetical protein HYU37_17820 [Acidobacteria bacterium]|nr:hypothetical protein [Acidobacteriota bacterium]